MGWLDEHDMPEVTDALWSLQHAEAPLTMLRAAADLREYASLVIDTAAREALEQGASQQAVAEALRISRQAVTKRYGAAAARPDTEAPPS